MRRNIDAWWPQVDAGAVEAIVMNASGCGVTVKDYGDALARRPGLCRQGAAHRRADPRPERAAARAAAADRASRVQVEPGSVLAFHPPCTLQHGQQLRGGVETGLRELGFDVRVAPNESHLCCGSAGTYSVLQPELAYQLRDRKLTTCSRCSRKRSSRPISAASSICSREPRHRCGTGSKCSTRRSVEPAAESRATCLPAPCARRRACRCI